MNIDDDLIQILKSMADHRKVSLGRAASEILRTGLERRTSYIIDEGLPSFEVREDARIITMDDIKSAEDEI